MGCTTSPKIKESVKEKIEDKDSNKSSHKMISNSPKVAQNEGNKNGGSHIFFSSSLYLRTHKEIPKDANIKYNDGEKYIAI